MKKLLFIFFLLISVSTFSQVYNQLQKVVASDRASGDQFGCAVAISGNYAIVGAYTAKEDTAGLNSLNNAGAAYIFEKNNNGKWIQKQKLVPSDRTATDYFGASVAIDSNRAVISAYEKDAIGGNIYTHTGAIYIFERNTNGVWNEKQKLVPADTSTKSHFGYAISISGDYIVAGAPLESEDSTAANTVLNSGAAYIFKRDIGGNWSQVKKIVASDRAATDYFGIAVSISNATIFVGAMREDEDSVGLNTINESGSVYVFEKNSANQWYQLQKIVAQDRGVIDRFGSSVSISGDKAVIGAFLEDENATGTSTMSSAGSAYIFERNTNGRWSQKQKIVASDRAQNDYFGIAAHIDCNTIIVGAEQESEDVNGGNTVMLAGSAYVFEKNSNGIWNQKQKIVASYRDPIDLFGHAVAVSNNNFIVGAYVEDEDATEGNSLNGSGSAYIFDSCVSNYTFFDTACFSYTSPSGNYVWTISNTYHDTIPNYRGCDSLITIHLVINTVNTLVTSSGATLTAATIANYQWVDCNNVFAIIPAAINQSYTATSNGDYAVIITGNGCVDTSACYTINSVGLSEEENTNAISIFPNPSSGKFYIKTNGNTSEIQITDIYGRVVYNFITKENTTMFAVNLSKGIYYASIKTQKKISIEKIIIE